MAKRAQNRGPYILAAGAAAQLLTGIPAAWGVFQQPVMQGYGFSRGQAVHQQKQHRVGNRYQRSRKESPRQQRRTPKPGKARAVGVLQ